MNLGVVLVQPKGGYLDKIGVRLPLGLLYVGTFLRQRGFDVKIFDQRVESMKRFYELLEEVSVVGVTCLVGKQEENALRIAKIAKGKDKFVIFGGVQPSLVPEKFYGSGLVDVVFRGSLKEVFVPDYSLVDMSKYGSTSYEGERGYSVMASRGCPFRCGFCYNSVFHNSRWNPYPLDLVLENIRVLVEFYGARTIYFVDDNVCVDIGRFKELLRRIKERFNINLAFQGIRIDGLLGFDDETYELLKESGVKSLDLGVESLNPRILRLIDKGLRREQIIKALEKVRSKGFNLKLNFLSGLPTQTRVEVEEDMKEAFRLEKEHPNSYVLYNVFIPFCGTPLYDKSLKCGLSMGDRFFFENMAFCFMLGNKNILSKVSNRLTRLLVRFYQPVARFRLKHNFYCFMWLEKRFVSYN